jgi:NAD(P)-dependent dehydrogenase (short-subunit alcohol dehydrogenase family)
MSEFDDQVVLITGAAGNIGRATATAFGQRGARLALFGRNTDKLATLERELGDDVEAHSFPVDLIDPESVRSQVEAVLTRFGRIDILANIAGGFTMGPPIHQTPDQDWDFMFDLNTRSVFNLCRAVVPHMLSGQHGRIVNVGARAALRGVGSMGPYCASKAAVITLTEALADEHKHDPINVNCILPGTVDTPENRSAMPDADHDSWVPPADLAEVILFLCGAASRSVSGAAIPVYGRS